jgi:hypothetical protein
MIPFTAAQLSHCVSGLYLLLVVAPAQLALDGSLLFDPLLQTGDVDVLDRADAFARRAHFGIGFSQVDADSALVLVVLA